MQTLPNIHLSVLWKLLCKHFSSLSTLHYSEMCKKNVKILVALYREQ